MKARNFVNPNAPPASAAAPCVYGIHPVEVWLRAHPARLRMVHYEPRNAQRFSELLRRAADAGVATRASQEDVLTAMAGTRRHQGVVATAAPYPYAEPDALAAATARLLIAADQLQDTHNLGALLRTAAAVGAGGVITPKDNCVPVTAAVESAAAGAAAVIPVYRVTNLSRTLQVLKQHGYWIVGLVPHGGIDLFKFTAPDRVLLVVGGETGMRPLVAKQCDFTVSIPMYGPVESLNASVATAIMAYELRRQWPVA